MRSTHCSQILAVLLPTSRRTSASPLRQNEHAGGTFSSIQPSVSDRIRGTGRRILTFELRDLFIFVLVLIRAAVRLRFKHDVNTAAPVSPSVVQAIDNRLHRSSDVRNVAGAKSDDLITTLANLVTMPVFASSTRWRSDRSNGDDFERVW